MDHGPIDRDDQINSDIDAMYELQREKAIWEEKMRARHKEPTETLWQLYLDTKKVRAGSTARPAPPAPRRAPPPPPQPYRASHAPGAGSPAFGRSLRDDMARLHDGKKGSVSAKRGGSKTSKPQLSSDSALVDTSLYLDCTAGCQYLGELKESLNVNSLPREYTAAGKKVSLGMYSKIAINKKDMGKDVLHIALRSLDCGGHVVAIQDIGVRRFIKTMLLTRLGDDVLSEVRSLANESAATGKGVCGRLVNLVLPHLQSENDYLDGAIEAVAVVAKDVKSAIRCYTGTSGPSFIIRASKLDRTVGTDIIALVNEWDGKGHLAVFLVWNPQTVYPLLDPREYQNLARNGCNWRLATNDLSVATDADDRSGFTELRKTIFCSRYYCGPPDTDDEDDFYYGPLESDDDDEPPMLHGRLSRSASPLPEPPQKMRRRDAPTGGGGQDVPTSEEARPIGDVKQEALDDSVALEQLAKERKASEESYKRRLAKLEARSKARE